ncbi:MAG: aminoacyl-tRNA hydrolase [Bdellovibrionaceae bacterium]|nr:aminoacyl-tRNA hydrolase [Pseudobdellovibrionaceae bacterium]
MSQDLYLFIGLGNPGDKYLLTRHNIGFMAIDWLQSHSQASGFKSEHKAEVAKLEFDGYKILLCKPQTFMNLSGDSVQSIMAYYKIQKQNILVLHDDLDMPFGSLRFMTNRSPGGHNGIKDIHNKIGADYTRLKIGISRKDLKMPADKFVLHNFSSEEMDHIPHLLDDISKASLDFLKNGPVKAANNFNRKLGLIEE